MTTPLLQLSAWYRSQCDGEWEHQRGISIQSLDNPGWWIKIDLQGTPLQSRDLERIDRNRADGAWLRCYREGDVVHLARTHPG